MTKEEIKVQKYLDALDLHRLENNRDIYDLDGYSESSNRTYENKKKSYKRID